MGPNLTSEELEELTWGSDIEDERVQFIAKQRGVDHRWESEWLLVVEFDGKLFGAHYREPLTEMQDAGYGAFENGCDWFEVEAVEVTETRYKEIKITP